MDENQNNQIEEEENRDQLESGLSSKEISRMVLIFFPSLIFIITTFISLIRTNHFCSQSYDILLKLIILLYTLFLLQMLIQIVFIYFKLNSLKPAEISITTTDIFLDLLYFGLVITTYIYFEQKPKSCFNENVLPTIILFCFILIGMVNFAKIIFKIFLIVLLFPFLVFYFLRDPTSFYSNFGVDPETINNLPTVSAKEEHCTTCVICSVDINVGDEILILKCPGKHYFHGLCIKGWLNIKLECPLCRSKNIF